jgi:hypothetical protein
MSRQSPDLSPNNQHLSEEIRKNLRWTSTSGGVAIFLVAALVSGLSFASDQIAGELGQSGSGARGQSGSGGRAVTTEDVLGQSGSGGRGQSGSGGRGQSGSGGRAITVADVLGQSGSGGRGQSGSGGRGQSGSGGRAITVADVLGQSGSGGRGQSGSGGRGQSGSGGRAVNVADVFGQSGSGGRGQSGSGARGALGIVEEVTSKNGVSNLVVLGQPFAVSNDVAQQVGLGDYVLVAGLVDGSATLQKVLEPYVAGVSPVALMGSVSSVDVRNAELTIGNAVVDYSSQLALDPALVPEAGLAYETVGIQPALGGLVLAGLQYDGAIVTVSSAL